MPTTTATESSGQGGAPAAASPTALVVGISGARRNAAAAIASGGRLLGVCEQERLTRIRRFALHPGELPSEAVAAVLGMTDRSADQVSAYVTAEDGVSLPAGLPRVRLDHHFGRPRADHVAIRSPAEGRPPKV